MLFRPREASTGIRPPLASILAFALSCGVPMGCAEEDEAEGASAPKTPVRPSLEVKKEDEPKSPIATDGKAKPSAKKKKASKPKAAKKPAQPKAAESCKDLCADTRMDLTDRVLRQSDLPPNKDLSCADMRGSDLSKLDLKGYSLRCAELKSADLGTQGCEDDFEGRESEMGARLSGATWINGRECPEGSVGHCPGESKQLCGK